MLGIGYVDVRHIPPIGSACQGTWIIHGILDKKNKIKIYTKVKINIVFNIPSYVHTTIGRLFTILIVKKHTKQPTLT